MGRRQIKDWETHLIGLCTYLRIGKTLEEAAIEFERSPRTLRTHLNWAKESYNQYYLQAKVGLELAKRKQKRGNGG